MLTAVRRALRCGSGSALRGGGWVALLVVSGLLMDAPAHAGAMGLQVGDVVSTVAFDSLQSVPGDGGSWDYPAGRFHADGRITQTNLTAGGPRTAAGVDLIYDLGLSSQSMVPAPACGTLCVHATATMPGFFSPPTASFSILNGSGVILNGFFAIPVSITGNINALTGAHTLSAAGIITIKGGDTNLVNALGGVGGNAWLLMSQSFSNFVPGLEVLGSDLNTFNSNFTVSMQGVITPFTTSPFVPEPSTALLVGFGILGILGLSRRARGLR